MPEDYSAIKAQAHKLVDAFFDEKVKATTPDTIIILKADKLGGRDPTTFNAFELQAAIDAKYIKLSVDPTTQDNIEKELKAMLVSGRVHSTGTRNARPDEEKDSFHNALGEDNTFSAAAGIIRKKMNDANASPDNYRILSYDADQGKLKVSVKDVQGDGMFHELNYNTVGSLAWKMKKYMGLIEGKKTAPAPVMTAS
jgi:hypothetical protein